MSIKIMSMIFDRYQGGGGELLLALAIADHAHDDGTHVFPSIHSLSIKTRQSERTIQYQIRSMEEKGWLELVSNEKGGRGKCREYRINAEWIKGADITPIPKIKGATDDIKGATDDIKGATDDIKGATAIAPESSVTVIKPSVNIKAENQKTSKALLLSDYLIQCQDKNVEAIPENSGVIKYADRVHIPFEFMKLAWFSFKKIHTDETRKEGKKRQKNWNQTFQNYVEGNWLDVWYIDKKTGKYELTTCGMQLKLEQSNRKVA